MKPALTTASLFLLLAPAAAIAEEWRWGEIPREELFAPYFAECPDAAAVVLLDHAVVRVDKKFHLRLQRHTRTKIMTDAGMDRAVVRIPYGSGEEIKGFRAHTVVPPGHLVKVEKQHVRDEANGTGRVMVVTFPGVQAGAVLEWDYELRSERIDTLPEWAFQGRDHVRVSRFELQLPPGMTYDAVFPWTPGMTPTPVKATINDPEDPRRPLARTAWELRDQAPVPALPFLPYPAEYRLTLHAQILDYTSTYESFPVRRSWEDLGKTMRADLDALLADSDGVAAWAGGDAATASAGAPERAAAIFARIRDGLATDPPRRGARPASPRAVVAAGHGTALEKNVVLLALLRAAGVPAEPVYVRTRPCGLFEPKRTDPAQLDHLLVRASAGDRTLWLDAAAHCPFGVLPPESRVARGLLVKADGGAVVDVAAPDPETARVVTTAASLDAHGTLAATSLVTLAGDRALAARRELASVGESGYVEGLIHARFGDSAVVESARLTAASTPEQPLSIEARYRVPAYARGDGERLICPPPFLEAMTGNPLPEDGRVIPVELPFTGSSREEVTVEIPSGYVLEAPPQPASARTPDLTLKTTHERADGAFTSTREVKAREARIEDEDFPKLRSFFDAACAADRAEGVARESSLRSSARP
jgi:transglutaminase-like putative cysteine protease